MPERSNRSLWLIFLALGFMWGSSYLFIKLAVDDFGTFTLVALRLLGRRRPPVGRASGSPTSRCRANAGSTATCWSWRSSTSSIPFMLITWAEQSVDSSLAAILTSPVPLFAIVLSALFLPDEPIRVNGVVGLVVGFIGVVIITSPGLTATGRIGHRRDRPARRGVQLCRRRGLLAA